jgi:hypothetical protein
MSRLRVFAAVVVTLVVIGVLAVGGAATYRAGWSQGYVNGRAVEPGEEGPADVPFRFGHRWRPGAFGYPVHPHGFPLLRVGLLCLFTLGLFVLPLLAVGKLLRFKAWRTACGPTGAHGPWHWPRFRSHPHFDPHHHPHPHPPEGAFPWCWGGEKPGEEHGEATGSAEQDSQTGDAEAGT